MALAALALVSCSKKSPPQPSQQARLDWDLKTSVGAYEEVGNTDARWDESAKAALTEYARSVTKATADEEMREVIRTNCVAAIEAGCGDPLVRYLYARYYLTETNSPIEVADALCAAAVDLEKSSYPTIRKTYADIRAVSQVFSAYGKNWKSVTSLPEIQRSLSRDIVATVQDKTLPPEEAHQVCSEALKLMTGSAAFYSQAYSSLEPIIFNNWPDASASWLLKSDAYYQMAWLARGGGYANNVSADAWKAFGEKLAVAETALNKAWELNPKDARIPAFMIRLAEGQQKSRPEMEKWFQRAMALDPNNYTACSYKLHYLYPQWYGSRDAMVAFGRECVASPTWGGSVPIILVDAHYEYAEYLSAEDRAAYYKQPDVWPDIKAAYEKFFSLNPDDTSVNKNYAWFAYQAEQWDAFNALVREIHPADYGFFGGKEEFDQMVQTAKSHGQPR